MEDIAKQKQPRTTSTSNSLQTTTTSAMRSQSRARLPHMHEGSPSDLTSALARLPICPALGLRGYRIATPFFVPSQGQASRLQQHGKRRRCFRQRFELPETAATRARILLVCWQTRGSSSWEATTTFLDCASIRRCLSRTDTPSSSPARPVRKLTRSIITILRHASRQCRPMGETSPAAFASGTPTRST